MPACEQIAQAVRSIATPIVRALDLELVDVECTGQGARTMVRVFIDKPNGVNVSDCEQVHVSLSHALDVQDPIPHTYTLEVSSPGLDRPRVRKSSDAARAVLAVHRKTGDPEAYASGTWAMAYQWPSSRV